MTLLRRGNKKSVLDYPEIVQKTMNKEEWYSHVTPFPYWVFWLSWTEHHVPQVMVMKEGSRVIFFNNAKLASTPCVSKPESIISSMNKMLMG